MQAIFIPGDVTFSDLKLARNAQTGSLNLDWSVIERICTANGIDIAQFADNDERLSTLIAYWYGVHVDQGGARDPLLDLLLGEIIAETEIRAAPSHDPGHA